MCSHSSPVKMSTKILCCVDFAIAYEGDVDARSLLLEIMDCRMLMKKRPSSEVPVPSTPEELLKFTIQYGKDVFPNLRTALRILLTISVSVASCERFFNKLKLIKTYLRLTMCQERLSKTVCRKKGVQSHYLGVTLKYKMLLSFVHIYTHCTIFYCI